MRKVFWFGLMAAVLLSGTSLFWLRSSPEVKGPSLISLKNADVRSRDCDYSPLFGMQLECYWVELREGQVGFNFSVAIFRGKGDAVAQDPLVYIPGGPGESGNTAPLMLSVWEEWAYRTELGRDFVLVDLRGLAPGYPHWDCAGYRRTSLALMQRNLTFAQEAELIAPVLEECLQEWRRDLEAQGGPVADLSRFTSLANAADLAEVLTRLGYQSWNYMGVSYGTRVALVAALSQPQARRIILDSPYPLDRGGVSDAGLLWAQTFADFWRECAERGCEFSEENFWQLMAHLRQQPQPVQVEDWNSGGQVSWLLNDGRLAAAVYSTFYSGDLRYQVAPALRRLIEGDIQPLLPLLEIFYNQAFDSSFNSAIFWATECNDNPLQSEQYFLSTLGQLGRWREYFAADWQFDLCRSTAFHPGQIPAMQPLEIPVLVAGGALDPITTHEHARELMPWLPRGQLLILPDRSHAEFYGSDCGERLIPWFLNADEVSIQAEWPAQSLSCRPAN